MPPLKYYVIADPHGYYTPTRRVLEAAGFFEETDPHKLIVCGDLLDRGTEAQAMVDFMLSLHREGRLIYILGNHEDLFVRCMQEIARGHAHEIASGMTVHDRNGTWDTMLQLTGVSERDAVDLGPTFGSCIRQTAFYQTLLPAAVEFYETPNYVFCHGWLPVLSAEPGSDPPFFYDENWRTAPWEARKNSRWLNGMAMACRYGITEPGKTVVCGHFHTSYGHANLENKGTEWGVTADYTPFRAEGILALDACTARSGIVNCIVIEDGEGICL